QEIVSNGRSGIKKAVILLTDGQANWIIGGTAKVDLSIAESKALTAVTDGFNTSKTVFFTIGFGIEGGIGQDGYNSAFLQKIATLTGGKYYYPAPGELQAVYQDISMLIGKGLLGGFSFNDVNGNGVFDLNEPKLINWIVQLVSVTGTKTFITDVNGEYTINGLCDGDYQLKEVLQSGWKQTLPTASSGYSITIANGNSFTDKNFGNEIIKKIPPCGSYGDVDGDGYVTKNDADLVLKYAVGSMTVLTNGKKNTSLYRKFKIRYTKEESNDFAMMEEVLRRRFNHPEWPFPDLLVVDGGKGQVSVALKVLKRKNLEIPLIGLAKREETIITSDLKEIHLPKDSKGLLLIMRIRDEAHRFAITYHR
ncbi:SdrD B-like domain-containing protein, partial [Deltaproteobacteria bacterium TL4]